MGAHPQEKLNGFNTLAPARESKSQEVERSKSGVETRLEKGTAYGQIGDRQSPIENAYDWPTYRRDARRSGFQDLRAPQDVAAAWTEKLAAPLTAPVVVGGKVFVAETDRHTLHALSAQDGKKDWTFDAEGRIDSPPTISDGLCLFGTRNGFVYCLRAARIRLAGTRFGTGGRHFGRDVSGLFRSRQVVSPGRRDSPFRFGAEHGQGPSPSGRDDGCRREGRRGRHPTKSPA